MLDKPRRLTGIGIIQTILASIFVIWLLFFPSRGVDFAWPVVPELTAMFIGAGFIARAYLGVILWREKKWHRLRWQVWGNMGFLVIIFLTTFWHLDEMNWTSSIIVAHIWVLAYAIEPMALIMIEPRGEDAKAPWPEAEKLGPIMVGLKRVMAVLWILLMIVAAVLFLNPEFADSRWPWPLNPFDARIMSAFIVLASLWALKVYFVKDWAEARPAIFGLGLLGVAHFIVWIVTVSQYRDTNRLNYGIILAIFTALIIYYFWRHERVKNNPEKADAETEA